MMNKNTAEMIVAVIIQGTLHRATSTVIKNSIENPIFYRALSFKHPIIEKLDRQIKKINSQLYVKIYKKNHLHFYTLMGNLDKGYNQNTLCRIKLIEKEMRFKIIGKNSLEVEMKAIIEDYFGGVL